MDRFFTIFTPTYNRAPNLRFLYNQLLKIHFKDFEWVIIDDGSTDNTSEIIKSFQKQNILEIRYYYQENQGKHVALNKGFDVAKGKYFICQDSDDYYLPNSLDVIKDYILKYNNNSNIAGYPCLCQDPNGETVGNIFPNDGLVINHHELYSKYNIYGDKGFIYKTEILKKYKLPVFQNEKFAPEAILHNRIAKKYDLLCINQKLEVKNYQKNGLSAKMNKLVYQNPKAFAVYYNERNLLPNNKKVALFNSIQYIKFSIFAKTPLKLIYHNSNYKIAFIPALIIALVLYSRKKIMK